MGDLILKIFDNDKFLRQLQPALGILFTYMEIGRSFQMYSKQGKL